MALFKKRGLVSPQEPFAFIEENHEGIMIFASFYLNYIVVFLVAALHSIQASSTPIIKILIHLLTSSFK